MKGLPLSSFHWGYWTEGCWGEGFSEWSCCLCCSFNINYFKRKLIFYIHRVTKFKHPYLTLGNMLKSESPEELLMNSSHWYIVKNAEQQTLTHDYGSHQMLTLTGRSMRRTTSSSLDRQPHAIQIQVRLPYSS